MSVVDTEHNDEDDDIAMCMESTQVSAIRSMLYYLKESCKEGTIVCTNEGIEIRILAHSQLIAVKLDTFDSPNTYVCNETVEVYVEFNEVYQFIASATTAKLVVFRIKKGLDMPLEVCARNKKVQTWCEIFPKDMESDVVRPTVQKFTNMVTIDGDHFKGIIKSHISQRSTESLLQIASVRVKNQIVLYFYTPQTETKGHLQSITRCNIKPTENTDANFGNYNRQEVYSLKHFKPMEKLLGKLRPIRIFFQDTSEDDKVAKLFVFQVDIGTIGTLTTAIAPQVNECQNPSHNEGEECEDGCEYQFTTLDVRKFKPEAQSTDDIIIIDQDIAPRKMKRKRHEEDDESESEEDDDEEEEEEDEDDDEDEDEDEEEDQPKKQKRK